MSTSPTKPRSVRKTARFVEAFQRLGGENPRAREALHVFEGVISRLADHGMAVPNFPDFLSWPVHLTESESVLVIYRLTEDEVLCLGVRPIASPGEGRSWES